MAGVGAESLSTFFNNFIEKKWDDGAAYDLAHFSRVYGLKQNVVQYYLQKYTYNKILCCVKVRNKTYYVKYKWHEHFKAFEKVLDYVKVIP